MTGILINRKVFADAVEFAKTAVPEKPIMEADGNITVAYAEGRLSISATDGCQGSKVFLAVDSGDIAPFSVGCDPKRLAKALAKDTSEKLLLANNAEGLLVADSDNAESKFTVLLGANMSRASRMLVWQPKDKINDVSMSADILADTLAFLEDFLPEGKDEGTKHDIAIIGTKVAHANNSVNMRGIVASQAFAFATPVCFRKKFVHNVVKAIRAMATDVVTVSDDVRMISIVSGDSNKFLVIPKSRQQPPVLPLEYMQAVGDPVDMDFKDVVKGLEKLSSANYNSVTTVTGVDIVISGEPADSTLQIKLEDGRAAATYPIKRTTSGTVERLIDHKSFINLLKLFSKSADSKLHFGEDGTRYLRLMNKKTYGPLACANIAVCSYARKN